MSVALRYRNTVFVDFRGAVMRLVARDHGVRRMLKSQGAICYNVGSAVNIVRDLQSSVATSVGRDVLQAVRIMSEPLEVLVETTTAGVLGLPDIPDTDDETTEMYL